MKTKALIVSALALLVVVTLSSSCKRQAIEEPGPFGPGTRYLSMDIAAYPNVLTLAAQRVTSDIRATVKIGGALAANQKVIFTIERGPGEFSDYKTRTIAYTNEVGIASVLYVSPTKNEISRDTTVVIEAQVETNTPFFLYRSVELRLMLPGI